MEHRELRDHAVLVQIANPARSEGRNVQGMQDEVKAISARVNAFFGTPGYTPIVLIDAPVTSQEKAAWLSSAVSSAPSVTGSTGSLRSQLAPVGLTELRSTSTRGGTPRSSTRRAASELVAGDGFRCGRFDRHAVPPAAPGPVAVASCTRGALAAHVAASRGHCGPGVAPTWGSGRWATGEDAEAARQGARARGRRLAKLW
jgi:hypothetical protein